MTPLLHHLTVSAAEPSVSLYAVVSALIVIGVPVFAVWLIFSIYRESTCPFCRKRLKKITEICPYCGKRIRVRKNTAQENASLPPKARKKKRK